MASDLLGYPLGLTYHGTTASPAVRSRAQSAERAAERRRGQGLGRGGAVITSPRADAALRSPDDA